MINFKFYVIIYNITGGSMDRTSACGAENLGFNPYWTQVSAGGFLTACISP